jgi:lambda repressor-like predicted transcriptional regulator
VPATLDTLLSLSTSLLNRAPNSLFNSLDTVQFLAYCASTTLNLFNLLNTAMHPADIKAALQKARKSSARIAEEMGVRPSTVSMIINGKGKSRRIAKKIARVIDRPVSHVWPGIYEKPYRISKSSAGKRVSQSAVAVSG